MSKTLTAEEWFKQNYHTPMDSFIGKYGIPVLHGVHDCGTEEWEDIPIHKVLEAYHKAKVDSRNIDVEDVFAEVNRYEQELLDNEQGKPTIYDVAHRIVDFINKNY